VFLLCGDAKLNLGTAAIKHFISYGENVASVSEGDCVWYVVLLVIDIGEILDARWRAYIQRRTKHT